MTFATTGGTYPRSTWPRNGWGPRWSAPGCHPVDVSWRFDGDIFAINWIERDGPAVLPPERCGFGSTVVDLMAKRTVDGEVELDYAPSGLTWRLTCPAANALERTNILYKNSEPASAPVGATGSI
jgi:hypothetical protein